jgi:hypothetical protein
VDDPDHSWTDGHRRAFGVHRLMNRYLPASVRFPGGYIVRIKTLAPSTLRRQAKGECFGYWDGATRTIFIDKTATERKQRYTLTHEMIHAFADWQHVYLGEDADTT